MGCRIFEGKLMGYLDIMGSWLGKVFKIFVIGI